MGTSLTYTDLCVADTADVIALCATWWYDSAWFKNTRMEFATTPEFWHSLFAQGVMIGTVGRDENGIAKACYVAIKQPYMFNHDYTVATEIVWCIDREYRNSRNLLVLFDVIESVLKRTHIDIYSLNIPVQEGHDRLPEYMKKQGFFEQDLVMFKEIKNG